jgi:predicted nucleic acid-binding protein
LSFVLDASVALAWVFDDERAGVPDSLLDALVESEAIVPTHWILEVTNGLQLAHRRGRLRPDEVPADLLLRIATLSVRVDPETPLRGWVEIPTLAERHRLTTYDAAYLELALRLNATLATVDNQLANAARDLGIRLFSGV